MRLGLYDSETIGCQIMGRTQSGVSKDSKEFLVLKLQQLVIVTLTKWLVCRKEQSLPFHEICHCRFILTCMQVISFAHVSTYRWCYVFFYEQDEDDWSYVPWSWGSPEDPCGCGILKLSCYYQSSSRQIKALSLLVWHPSHCDNTASSYPQWIAGIHLCGVWCTYM